MSEPAVPDQLRYTADHEWVALGDGATARVGITAFAADALGDVVYVSLPQVGDQVRAGDSCGEVESTKSVNDLYAPLDGQVTRVNEVLDTSPDLINTDPYGQGWMFELTVPPGAAADRLLDAAAYRALLG